MGAAHGWFRADFLKRPHAAWYRAEDNTIKTPEIRNAATVIVLRNRFDNPAVLMGQRGANAAFMPNKFVFPGGAVDASDSLIPLHRHLSAPCSARICEQADEDLGKALSVAGIRELWEETGLILGTEASWPDSAPPDWQGFAARGFLPDAGNMKFVFRAITPPGRPRRFDARFFLVDAEHLQGDIDDFSAASDELSHLQWVPLEVVRGFDMPFITEVVLAEIQARLDDPGPPESVPFFKNDDEASLFLRLYGTDVGHPD